MLFAIGVGHAPLTGVREDKAMVVAPRMPPDRLHGQEQHRAAKRQPQGDRNRGQLARQCRSTPLQTQIGHRKQPRRADLNGNDEAVG